MEEKSYKEYLNHITTFIFDVDGVLTNGDLHVTNTGELLRIMNVRDGFALKFAVNSGYNVAIISAGTNEGVKIRLEALGIKTVYLGAHKKLEKFYEYIEANDIKPENVLYMGDDMPDYPVLKVVGLPCCPQDAVAEVKGVAKYISHKNGGQGAVRDVIEQVLKVQDKWVF
ncbi:MAG: 3-deoxy-D-manno-octulosonate 8-phosphate phosphatase [Flavobacteriales bacterium 32-35-8]|nr:MAG: 3-deoxy-D-manno-octulosonate 8-phosphate phosphatase [Flavobacteriales bacterium 32-35-8]